GLRQGAAEGAAEGGLDALALQDRQCLHVGLTDDVDRTRARLGGGGACGEQGDRTGGEQTAAERNKLLHVNSVSRVRLRTYLSGDEWEAGAEARSVTSRPARRAR